MYLIVLFHDRTKGGPAKCVRGKTKLLCNKLRRINLGDMKDSVTWLHSCIELHLCFTSNNLAGRTMENTACKLAT